MPEVLREIINLNHLISFVSLRAIYRLLFFSLLKRLFELINHFCYVKLVTVSQWFLIIKSKSTVNQYQLKRKFVITLLPPKELSFSL